mmetsp:Transcript_4384/g.9505  ORF Transcript_4384/g.9505 Transcript_4384/m.9505 type:complete len:227 (-) Transcript_4384:719-1399(-)
MPVETKPKVVHGTAVGAAGSERAVGTAGVIVHAPVLAESEGAVNAQRALEANLLGERVASMAGEGLECVEAAVEAAVTDTARAAVAVAGYASRATTEATAFAEEAAHSVLATATSGFESAAAAATASAAAAVSAINTDGASALREWFGYFNETDAEAAKPVLDQGKQPATNLSEQPVAEKAEQLVLDEVEEAAASNASHAVAHDAIRAVENGRAQPISKDAEGTDV